MRRSLLEQARNLMKRRKFGTAARLLEGNSFNYKGSFEYYLALGTCSLYLDDEVSAAKYYESARGIHANSSELLLGQAALFLRHGNNANALQYYLDVLEVDPENKVAKEALEFIRTKGKDYMVVQRLVSNGGIKRFYPQLGTNPDVIRDCFFAGMLLVLLVVFVSIIWPREKVHYNGKRADLSNLELSTGEKKNSITDEISSNTVHFYLDNDTSELSYGNAVNYFQEGRDNAAHVEINRILNSNAVPSIKVKASLLLGQLSDLTFDTLPDVDNYSYETVSDNRVLYGGCFVAWQGRIANPVENSDGSWQCDLMIGYEDLIHHKGTVPVVFKPERRSPVNPERPIRILGVVSEKAGKIYLDGRAIYQPVKGKFE